MEANVTQFLQSAGLRRTPVRQAVAELLLAASRPLSVQELLQTLPPATDLVTVYRTLHTLVAKRLVRRVRGEDRTWLFEFAARELGASRDEHIHAHFVCDNCGTVECLPDVELPPMPSASNKLAKGYDVTKQEVTLHGTCPKCH